jgi:hypothetical protein
MVAAIFHRMKDLARGLRLRRIGLKAFLLLSLAGSFVLFVLGTYHGRWSVERHRPTFHDMITTHTVDYRALIAPDDQEVQSRAKRFTSLPEAYYFVRDSIAFDPSTPTSTPSETLASGRASCLGKATLLCSLYRAMGVPPARVHVVVGEVTTPRFLSEHAWLEIDAPDGACLQQDATTLLATFDFNAFPGNSYAEAFVRKEAFCFNDQGFAVVSQLNRMEGSHPFNSTVVLPSP